MNFFTVLLVAVALGADALSMAVSVGLNGIRKKHLLLFPLIVSIFHVIMPLAGLYLGGFLGRALGQVAGIIGALVLIFIGITMLKEGFTPEAQNTLNFSAARKTFGASSGVRVMTGLWGLIVLAASVSLDALSVGFGLGAYQVNLALTVLTMGVAAGIMTVTGLLFGKILGNRLEDKAQIVGGFILVGIGIRMFFG